MNIKNLLSLATMACAEIHVNKDFDAPEKALSAIDECRDLYGDVPKDVQEHLYGILSAHRANVKEGKHWYAVSIGGPLLTSLRG